MRLEQQCGCQERERVSRLSVRLARSQHPPPQSSPDPSAQTGVSRAVVSHRHTRTPSSPDPPDLSYRPGAHHTRSPSAVGPASIDTPAAMPPGPRIFSASSSKFACPQNPDPPKTNRAPEMRRCRTTMHRNVQPTSPTPVPRIAPGNPSGCVCALRCRENPAAYTSARSRASAGMPVAAVV